MRRSGESIRTFVSWLGRATGTGEARAARRAARSWRRGGSGLIILCLLVYIPGLWTIPPVDRDESRFAQASRQMLESGTLEGWVVPRVQDKPRLNKPPLIYWLQASSAGVLGDAPGQWSWLDGGSENIWVYRVPSVLSAMAAVLLTWRLGVRMFDPRAAWLGAALLAVCPMVVWDAHQARADQLLLATTTATMLALWCVWSGRRTHHGDTETRRREESGVGSNPIPAPLPSPSVSPCLRGEARLSWVLAFWVCLGLGIMTKGPITPLIAGLTCVALSLVSRNWRWMWQLRPALGVLIIAAMVGPWVYLVGREVGWSAYFSIIYDETIGRSAGAKEGHWGPPGYHIVLLGVLFWPGSLLTAAAIGRAWKRGTRATVPPLPSLAPPPPRGGAAGEVSRESASVTEGACDASGPATHPLRQTRKASSATSPAGGGGGAIRRLARHVRALRPSRSAELFLLAWMLPSWVVFELISTKLPHYTMPLYPAVALMSARAVFGARAMFLPALGAAQRRTLAQLLARPDARCPACRHELHGVRDPRCPECGRELRTDRRQRLLTGYCTDRSQLPGRLLWFLFGIVIALVVPLAFAIVNNTGGSQPRIAFVSIVLGLFTASVCLLLIQRLAWQLYQDRLVSASLLAIALSTISLGATCGVLLPDNNSLWISRDIASALRRNGWKPDTPLACSGYVEDSLVFLTRGAATRLFSPDDFEQWIERHPHSVVIVGLSTLRLGVTLEYPPSRQIQLWESFEGFNYSTGMRIRIRVEEYFP